MTPSDDLSPPRRPIFFPVVIATVFLTIIGLAAGFVLGEKRNNEARVEPTPTPTAPTSSGPASGSSRPSCPPEAGDKAASIGLPSDLQQVMKVLTDNGTTVWICTDGKGGFYYQSKTGGPDQALVQGTNGLFLFKVEQLDTDHYVAVDHLGNRFEVTNRRLQVTFVDGRDDQVNQVVSVG